MILKIKKLAPNIIGITKPAIDGDVGYDIYSNETTTPEPHKSLVDCVKNEIYEEGGYQLEDENKMIATSKFIGSTQMNETTFVFLVDLTNLKQFPITNDGSYLETISKTKWVSQKDLESILEKETSLVSLNIAYQLFITKKSL